MDEGKVREVIANKIKQMGRGGLTRVAEEVGVCRSYMSMMIKGERPLCPLVVAKYGRKP